MTKKLILLFSILFFVIISNAQLISVSGTVKDSITQKGIAFAIISLNNKNHFATDSLGNFSFKTKEGTFHASIDAVGYKSFSFSWNVDQSGVSKEFKLQPQESQLSDVKVKGTKDWDVALQKQTVGTSIYAGKKNEIIDMGKLSANTATNNSRQIYAKVPGVNIIENDEAGVQLSIATRGLNPNRTTEFNSRQNGYDIAADPIGYPETYYSPPTDGLQSIEIVRGAASLQYGTQFGGLLNFHFKEPPTDKNFELVTKQTVGSYGFFNSFNSVGGNAGKWSYYGFYDYKRSDGWRQNT
ncbi:MAG TPA: carboxypeptidase-like regulatory domain-containing protein, partial [Arachidicoccus sp.]